MSNFTPVRIFGIIFGIATMVIGIIWALVPASFIFSSRIEKADFMVLDGTVSRVDLVVKKSSGRRSTTTSYYASVDINEFPDFTFQTHDHFYFTVSDIKRVTESFVVGDSIKMVIEKDAYTNKITKPIPTFPSNPKTRKDRMIKHNYKFIEVFGYQKGHQDILSFDDYFESRNSPAGFFSYFFFSIAMCMVLAGLFISYKVYKKAVRS